MNEENIIEFIRNYHKEHGYSPSYEEIRIAFGYKFRASVGYRIKKLIKEGKLTKQDKVSRSLIIKEVK